MVGTLQKSIPCGELEKKDQCKTKATLIDHLATAKGDEKKFRKREALAASFRLGLESP